MRWADSSPARSMRRCVVPRDPRFTRTVIYMCAHTTDGAMGLVINRLVGSLSFPDLLQQLGIPTSHCIRSSWCGH